MGTGVRAAGAQGSTETSSRINQLIQISEKNNRDVAQAMNALTQIQQEFQSIRGQVEASKYLTKETDRIYQDLDMRVSSLEDKIDQIHTLVKAMAAPKPVEANPAGETSSREVEEFQVLLAMVNARDYRGAASGFMGFMKKYPKSPHAGSAQYWVGECYYSMGDFAKSIQDFQKFVEKYPNHERVKEAVYKQGLSFMRLNKNEEAKLFFQKVLAAYPNTVEAAKAQARLHRIEETERQSQQVALGQSPDAAASPQPKKQGETTYRPIMKPVPMPGAHRPATPLPQPTPEPPAQDTSGPLF
jgi:tol-pal system protein YbgF